jgi:2-methylisocitrate lyase-like PEP mutase family enzyme
VRDPLAKGALTAHGTRAWVTAVVTTFPLGHHVVTARDRGAPLLLPGAYDALSARLAEAAGFDAIYITGAGLANARFGVPDVGLVTLDGLVDHVAAIDDVVDAALVVDADTGFGNAVNVTHAVRRLERAGADAIQLEDQVSPKKCGHFAGKAVIDADEMELKLRAALDARRSDDTLIIARTDARATHGLEAALERAERYRAAGADAIFVEAPTSTAELRAVAAAIDAPLVANMVEGGTTPLLDCAALGAMGYAIVLYANAALRCAQRAVTDAYAELRATGSSAGLTGAMATWEERQAAVGKPAFDALEARYATP